MNNLKPRKRSPNICARCESDDVVVSHKSDIVDYKGLTLEVDGLAGTVCNNCGYDWVTDGQEHDNNSLIKEAYVKKRDATRAKEGLLTAEQIEYVLVELKLTRSDASSIFGGGPNAFSKYIAGDVLQSAPMDRLLRLTLAFGGPAVRYLRECPAATLELNAGGFFVAPPLANVSHVTFNTTSVANNALITEASSNQSAQRLTV